jgi:putative toxin-antitoxin system antitoxin component (TIGR02293 family)
MTRQKEDRASASESNPVSRLGRVAARAEKVLGRREAAQLWLIQPNRALGGSAPISMLDTDEGIDQIEAVLGRIEHGVFS